MRIAPGKLLLLLLLVLLIGSFLAFDLRQYLTLATVKAQQAEFQHYYAGHRTLALATYFLVYVAVTALSLPGAAVLTLAGGALFGFWATLVTVSFASTLGATLAFLSARYLVGRGLQARYGDWLRRINEGIARDGAFYLFSMRLVPYFPFVLINLLMGLTPMPTLTYAAVSQLGMLPVTAVYVNAGSRLGEIRSLGDIASPGLLLSFALLGLFPLLAKKSLDWLRRRRTG